MNLILTIQEKLLLLAAIEHEGSEIKITAQPLNGEMNIKGEEDDFLLMHEACQEYLLFRGFDEDYNLTSEGEILESLIDKIFNTLEKSNS